MSLEQRLAAMREGAAKMIPAATLAVMHRATEQLRGRAEQAVGVGDRLPSFALFNQDGHEVRASDVLTRGPLVLTFFRGVW